MYFDILLPYQIKWEKPHGKKNRQAHPNPMPTFSNSAIRKRLGTMYRKPRAKKYLNTNAEAAAFKG